MKHDDISVTSMKHTVLSGLESVPLKDLGNLCAVDLHGGARFYSFDSFRRLYNDAVESMDAYRRLLASAEEERDFYASRCSELEAALREMAGDWHLVMLHKTEEGDRSHF